MARGRLHDDDTAVGSRGQFVALESFSTKGNDSSFDDESTVETTDYSVMKDNARDKTKVASISKTNATNTIEKTSSADSTMFNDQSCGACLGALLGWNPDNVVVKVLVSVNLL
jgi:hypothetical protein